MLGFWGFVGFRVHGVSEVYGCMGLVGFIVLPRFMGCMWGFACLWVHVGFVEFMWLQGLEALWGLGFRVVGLRVHAVEHALGLACTY